MFFILLILLTVSAFADDEPPAPKPVPAWKSRVANFSRRGWVVVDGRFAKPQADVSLSDLFLLDDSAARIRLLATPAARVEPLLKNDRTGLVRVSGTDFAWTLTCAGRVWNDTHSAGTQQLDLRAVEGNFIPDATPRLTHVQVTPQMQVVQAVVEENGEKTEIRLTFRSDQFEAAVGVPNGGMRLSVESVTSTDLRQLYRDHPAETRQYVVPVLKLLTGGRNPLAPAAADVYRVFADLPTDPRMAAAVQAQLPNLAHPDPAVRERASAALAALGPRGVQAAMRIDRTRLPPEAAERLAAFVAPRDPRSTDDLRRDPYFLADCQSDPDPNVRSAAATNVVRK